MKEVVSLSKGDTEEVVDVLCDAFKSYPIMKFVLGETEEYQKKYRMLIHFFVMNRVLKDEYMYGIREGGALIATAIVSLPYRKVHVPELEALREEVWKKLGNEARVRYDQFVNACSELDVDTPQIHLNMIGVREGYQNKGLGRKLIQYVHGVSEADPNSEGVSLSTEIEKNVSFYKHMGYKCVGKANVSDAFTTWSFFRTD